MSLEEQIKKEIQHNGPMNIAAFMGQAVSHYYNNRDPFGEDGDFITAPEISQMFGEMIGAWAADCWVQLGRPDPFFLIECGPGRGTLMADAMRATKNVPGFHSAAQIHLIEMSQTLKEKQKAVLADYQVYWHESLSDAPQDMPMILLANEFLDALPIRQYQFTEGRWHERVIGLDENESLQFSLLPTGQNMTHSQNIEEGDVIEISEAQQNFVEEVCSRLKSQGGSALLIDYGYVEGHGDTLQAMKSYEYVPVLEDIGNVDLTTHVDFTALARCADRVKICGPVMQGDFLQRLGISQRAAMLKQHANEAQAEDIDAALIRLTTPGQMGELFKVMAFCHDDLNPAGF